MLNVALNIRQIVRNPECLKATQHLILLVILDLDFFAKAEGSFPYFAILISIST